MLQMILMILTMTLMMRRDAPTEAHSNKNRPYVSLDLDNAKETIGEKVIETIDKTKEKIENFNVSEKLDKAKGNH